jgi:hypothetical protein
MRLSRFIIAFAITAAICLAGEGARATAQGNSAEKSDHPTQPPLPNQFGGWQIVGAPRTSADPAVADPANAALLKEYGFTDFESATYTRDNGRKLALKAARFGDASGAYGAFTYYKTPEMLVEKIGDQAASLNERVLFYRGNILVDAVFQQLTAMSAAELRDLAANLPLPSGNTRNLPGLPAYLPKQSYIKNSAKYVLGPEGLQRINAPIPASLVAFDAGAEVVLGNYNTSGGEAALMLISYPTPQIAADHLRRINAVYPQNGSGARSAPDAGPIFGKRTGPILVLAVGPFSASEAQSLLASVNYDADVTWNENTYFDKKNNIGTLVWNALILSGILILFALAIGLAFGGIRILLRRLLPQRGLDRPGDVEFIALHLSETIQEDGQTEVKFLN